MLMNVQLHGRASGGGRAGTATGHTRGTETARCACGRLVFAFFSRRLGAVLFQKLPQTGKRRTDGPRLTFTLASARPQISGRGVKGPSAREGDGSRPLQQVRRRLVQSDSGGKRRSPKYCFSYCNLNTHLQNLLFIFYVLSCF